MGKTVKKGPGVFTVLVLFILGVAFILGVIALVRIVYPESLDGFFGSRDEQLVAENARLQAALDEARAQLSESRGESGELRGELFLEKSKRFAWAIFLGIVVVGAFLIWLLVKGWGARRGLTMAEAQRKYDPIAREMYGFPKEQYPVVKCRRKSVERVKREGGGVDREERMFWLEFEFLEPGDLNRYVKGTAEPFLRNTVTVAILNMTDEVNQQWFPFLSMGKAIKESHGLELWGFALQKSRIEEDLLAAVETVRTTGEIKEAYEVPQAPEGSS